MELALEVREVAAVDLVARGQLDPRDALALVAWPSVAVVAASVAAVAAAGRASGAARRSGCGRSSWSIRVGRGCCRP
jgi:hypothetical protein